MKEQTNASPIFGSLLAIWLISGCATSGQLSEDEILPETNLSYVTDQIPTDTDIVGCDQGLPERLAIIDVVEKQTQGDQFKSSLFTHFDENAGLSERIAAYKADRERV